ncbi:hypothetical protein COCNU_08G008810 [Cocos nucifera]|uniref:Uncharacterized protein n=1 Tax=Cocos nucifera TaxID=13894 RepID=A0A8K0IIP0_COCNU|nr:hypothetical protein COCNU_08G008810 [Cocos nucifera]
MGVLVDRTPGKRQRRSPRRSKKYPGRRQSIWNMQNTATRRGSMMRGANCISRIGAELSRDRKGWWPLSIA